MTCPAALRWPEGWSAKRSSSHPPTTWLRLPGYTRLDASASYRHRRYELQVNLQNLGNGRFYDAAQGDYQIYPAAPDQRHGHPAVQLLNAKEPAIAGRLIASSLLNSSSFAGLRE